MSLEWLKNLQSVVDYRPDGPNPPYLPTSAPTQGER